MTTIKVLKIVLEASGEYQTLCETNDMRDSERNRTFTLEALAAACEVVNDLIRALEAQAEAQTYDKARMPEASKALLAEAEALEQSYAEAEAFDRRMAEAAGEDGQEAGEADEMAELRKAALSQGQP